MPYGTQFSTSRSAPWQLQDVEALVDDLKNLLSKDSDVSSDENIREELKVLERWDNYFQRELVTQKAFSEASHLLLAGLHDRLKQVIDEMQRLEGEGGAVATKEQADRNEARLRVMRHIERLMNRDLVATH